MKLKSSLIGYNIIVKVLRVQTCWGYSSYCHFQGKTCINFLSLVVSERKKKMFLFCSLIAIFTKLREIKTSRSYIDAYFHYLIMVSLNNDFVIYSPVGRWIFRIKVFFGIWNFTEDSYGHTFISVDLLQRDQFFYIRLLSYLP